MPIFTVPIHETPLREFNKCHEPGGPDGGQFCSDPTGGPDAPAKTVFQRLKNKWTQLNHQLLPLIDHPNSPEAVRLKDEQKTLVKEMYRMDISPEGLDDLGQPGGPRDMVIVGAGPGGLSAAIGAGYEGLDTLLVEADDKVGGQAKFSSRVENYPGFPIGATGESLANSLYDQAQRAGAETRLGTRVIGLAYDEATGLKTLTLSTGETLQARSVVVAGGLAFVKRPFAGDDAANVIYGDGEALAKAAAGKPVVIIGGSNGAAQAALRASLTSSQVYVLSRSPVDKLMSGSQVSALKANPKIAVIEGDELQTLVKGADGRPTEVVTVKGQRLPTAALGLFTGSSPSTGWLSGVTLSKGGKIATGANYETNIPGVFAVGDIRDGGGGRMIVAAGEGQVAVRNAFDWFKKMPKRKP